jgi:hypothetical protein
VANTCLATLALLRAGNTPRTGPYARNVANAVEFICGHVTRADKDSLYVTGVRGTQVQSKIGPFVDTFLAALVLAELKGEMPDEKGEQKLVASLQKTVAKIEKHQKEDGTFAGLDPDSGTSARTSTVFSITSQETRVSSTRKRNCG